MKQYRVVEGDRLDTIVFKAYGSNDAEIIDTVMEENEHLLKDAVLSAGDVISLPEIETKATEFQSKALW